MSDGFLFPGVQQEIVFTFRDDPSFSTAPLWEAVEEDDSVLASGMATVGAATGEWIVTLTIPAAYVSMTGQSEIYIEVYGTDSDTGIRSVAKVFQIIDGSDSFVPKGIVAMPGQPITDSLILNNVDHTAAQLSGTIFNMSDTVLLPNQVPTQFTVTRAASVADVPDRFSAPVFEGYRYDMTFGAISTATSDRYPHQMRYTISHSTDVTVYEMKPLFVINGKFLQLLNSLNQYLDKARLIEIDPTLQWQTDELCQSILEGLMYVNSYPADLTHWTITDLPVQLYTYIWYAAAVHALNARYLAEGFTAFNFTGLSTSLEVDRREAIIYKIEELKGILDANLQKVKASAIRNYGKGTPDEETMSETNNYAVLGLGASLVSNNVIPNWGTRRYRRF